MVFWSAVELSCFCVQTSWFFLNQYWWYHGTWFQKTGTYQAMKSHFISKAIPKYIVVLLASIIHKKEICFSRRCRLDQAQVNFARDRVFFYGNFPSSKCRMSQKIQLVRTAYRDRGSKPPASCNLHSSLSPLFSSFLVFSFSTISITKGFKSIVE